MSRAALGDIVRLTYDHPGQVAPGVCLMTRTGRLYLVVDSRRQLKGKHRGRWHLRAVVVEGPPPLGSVVLPLVWYSRGPRRPPAA